MLKDEEYFNAQLFSVSNSEIKNLLKQEYKKQKTTLYLIVDEALRQYLEGKGHTIEVRPKKPQLV